MKIELYIDWKRAMSLILAAMLLGMLALMCLPYFEYGAPTSVYIPKDSAGGLLSGKWVLDQASEGEEGYVEIIFVDAKTIHVAQWAGGQLYESEGKASFKPKTGVLKLTYAEPDGSKVTRETTFAPSFQWGQIQHISVLGYAALPFIADEFTAFLKGQFDGFFINQVIFLPVALFVLAVLGLIFCFAKYGKAASAYLPAAFGLVGVTGYAFSAFLKLGSQYTLHMTGFAVIFLFSTACIVAMRRSGGRRKNSNPNK